MHSGPVPADDGRDEDPARRVPEPEDWEPVIIRPDPMTEEEWLAWLDATVGQDEPPEDEEEPSGEYDGPEFGIRPAAPFATGLPFDPIATDACDHRFEAKGHDPGVKLRHLSQIRHATCTGPGCRRPSTHADFEHNIPYEAGGWT
jgi:hypothetical protein